MKTIKILDVKLNQISKGDLLKSIEDAIEQDKKCRIYTVNNEFIVDAQNDKNFLEALNRSDFSIPDSTGVLWAAKKLYKTKLERIPGADLFMDLARLSQEKAYKIFLLGAGESVAEKAAAELKKIYPNVIITGTLGGVEIDPDKDQTDIIDIINRSEADILCVALGAPKQELFIDKNFKKINAKVFVGIGGTLDYVSGHIKRAPQAMRRLGLEWLYRFINQPSRKSRMRKALITFPALVRKAMKTA